MLIRNQLAKIQVFFVYLPFNFIVMKEFEENDNQLVKEFKTAVDANIERYYDSQEYEIIIEELISEFDFEYLDIALQKAIELYPMQSPFRLYKVKSHILKFELDLAEEELARIENDFEPTPEFYMEKVYLSNILNKHEENIKWLKKALDLAPNEPDIHFLLGFELLKRKQLEESLEHVIFALQNDISFEEQLSIYSFLFEEEKWYDEALHFYTALTEEFPFAGATWFGLGLSYSWLDRFEDSIEAYKLALTCDNEIGTAYFNIGNAYFEMKHFENAIEYYELAHDIDHADFHSLSNIADCYMMLKEEEKALDYYRKTLDINPNHNEAIIGIANVLKKRDQDDEAILFIEKAFANTPQDMDLLFMALTFYAEDNQTEALLRLIDLTLKQLEDYDEFFKYFTNFCVANEFLETGFFMIQFYSHELDVAKRPAMMDYYYAAFSYLTDREEFGKPILEDALTMAYDLHDEFLAISSLLEDNEEIQHLIQQYHP
jgi:tetratricopeptide (TPR) repeat protein